MPDAYKAYLWVADPAAEGNHLGPVFSPTEATKMNSANAQQFSRAANDMFHEYTWGPVKVGDEVYLVAGKNKAPASR